MQARFQRKGVSQGASQEKKLNNLEEVRSVEREEMKRKNDLSRNEKCLLREMEFE